MAVVLMALCLSGLGGWLLPRMGLDAGTARIVASAIGGMIVAVLYQRMKPRRAA